MIKKSAQIKSNENIHEQFVNKDNNEKVNK